MFEDGGILEDGDSFIFLKFAPDSTYFAHGNAWIDYNSIKRNRDLLQQWMIISAQKN